MRVLVFPNTVCGVWQYVYKAIQFEIFRIYEFELKIICGFVQVLYFITNEMLSIFRVDYAWLSEFYLSYQRKTPIQGETQYSRHNLEYIFYYNMHYLHWDNPFPEQNLKLTNSNSIRNNYIKLNDTFSLYSKLSHATRSWNEFHRLAFDILLH